MSDKKETLITPIGVVGPYPAIDRVDFGTDEYPDADGSYKCEVRLDKKDPKVKELMKRFDAMMPEIEKTAKDFEKKMLKTKGKKVEVTINPMYREVYDEEGEETGQIAVKAKTKSSGVNKKSGETWKRKLPIRDSKGNVIKEVLGISTGSRVKMAATIGDVYANPNAGAGRALFLDGIKLYELVQYGGSDPFGDDEEMEEGGYEYDASDAQEPTSAFDKEDEEDDNDEEPDFAS